MPILLVCQGWGVETVLLGSGAGVYWSVFTSLDAHSHCGRWKWWQNVFHKVVLLLKTHRERSVLDLNPYHCFLLSLLNKCHTITDLPYLKYIKTAETVSSCCRDQAPTGTYTNTESGVQHHYPLYQPYSTVKDKASVSCVFSLKNWFNIINAVNCFQSVRWIRVCRSSFSQKCAVHWQDYVCRVGWLPQVNIWIYKYLFW